MNQKIGFRQYEMDYRDETFIVNAALFYVLKCNIKGDSYIDYTYYPKKNPTKEQLQQDIEKAFDRLIEVKNGRRTNIHE